MADASDKKNKLQAILREAERAAAAPAENAPPAPAAKESAAPAPMAIIGLAGRYPGGDTIDAFWDSLMAGRNCVEEISGERAADYSPENGGQPGDIRHFGLLKDVYRFDAPFFNISRREAEVMDPHMRLLLETVWSCFENAGCRPRSTDRQTGVFISFYNHEYSDLLRDLDVDASSGAYLATATTGAILANRISFLLGLNGPSEVYDTACSTALVALHRAMQAIRAGDCRQAVVAGVSLLLTPNRVAALSGLGILNPTGVCNPYSHPANKEIIGEGVGAMLVKPLADAVRDRDYIYAVIRGSEVNHHGDRSGGLTLPSADSLADLMAETCRKTGIAPGAIRYIEGHGAGSEADVIELRAVQKFLSQAGLNSTRVRIGSIKGNIGFGEASGGMAQLTKCALALHHGEIPATLHFKRVDPVFDLENSALVIQSENTPLANSGPDECLSVLAYGLGGSNAHILLSGHVHRQITRRGSGELLPVPFSAGSEQALARYVRELAAHFQNPARTARYQSFCLSDRTVLACAARTLAGRERNGPCRIVFLAEDARTLRECCSDYLSGAPNRNILRMGQTWDRPAATPSESIARTWLDGGEVSWETCFGPGDWQKLPLPPAPFEGGVYRLKPKHSPAQTPAALEDRWTVSRAGSGWVVELPILKSDRFMDQHLVDGMPVMPAAGYIALLTRIARKIHGYQYFSVENLAWTMPLAPGDGPATLRFEFEDSGAFRAYHRETSALCCKGRLEPAQSPPAADLHARVDGPGLRGLRPMVDRQAYWAMANAPGTRQSHGPELRSLAAIHHAGETMIGVLDPVGRGAVLREIAFYDSALGTCRGFSWLEPGEAQAVVPFAVERVRILQSMPAGITLFAAARQKPGALSRFDISIEDGAGVVYTVIEGYHARPFTSLTRPGEPSRTATSPPPLPPVLSLSSTSALLDTIRERVAAFLKCDLESVPLDESLAPLGLDSIGINALTDQISARLGFELPATALFEHTTIQALAGFLAREFPDETKRFARETAAPEPEPAPANTPAAGPAPSILPPRSARSQGRSGDIAVIGMGGLFPGASSVRAFWEKIRAGQDLVTEIPPSRRGPVYEVYADAIRELGGFYGGFVEDADKFDAAFFGYGEEEVMAMDPQQRLFLEAAWAAVEDAGYFPPSLSGKKIGVYAGAIVNDYGAYLADSGYPVSMLHEGTGASLAGIANRVSYFLNLTGPSQAVDTACCSSLYAIDRAVNDILGGQCEAALAGGVSFVCTPSGYQMYSAMNLMSKDWRCKAFAGGGDGWSKAEIFAAVFLKPVEDAVRDNDPVYAVIKATGTNHGGKGYFYTQPNGARHVELIRDVYLRAGVSPRSIVHVEAHGSGTEMGDALEFNSISKALTEVARETGESLPPGSCGVGSIKSNIGHAEAGAGVAGFIKTVMLLHEGRIPPTIHLGTVNKHINLKNSPLYLVRAERPVSEGNAGASRPPSCAGVHSFNFSGATAHALVAEHFTAADGASLGLTRYPVCLSAKSPEALTAYGLEIASFLKSQAPSKGLLDRVVRTINLSKSQFECRRGILAGSIPELIAKLESPPPAGGPNDLYSWVQKGAAKKTEYPVLSDENAGLLMERWLREPGFDWAKVLRDFPGQRLHLPTYPFEHQRSYFPRAGAARAVPAARTPNPAPPVVPRKSAPSKRSIEDRLTNILADLLSIPPASVDLDLAVNEFGFDSLKIIKLSEALNASFGLATTPPDLFEFSTPREMAGFITDSNPAEPRPAAATPAAKAILHDGIAIIGISGQFPGARDLDGFWQNLVEGKDAISEIPPDRWDWRQIHGDPQNEPGKTNVRWGGFIADTTIFDPLFFGISPREAEGMDPQQRLIMMHAWRAIEDAGYRPSSFSGSNMGLFIGTGSTNYGSRSTGTSGGGEPHGSTGAIPSIGPNRLSYFLNLRGPSEPVETSCSSSLVAIHRAVSAIRAGECDTAIAGGVNTIVTADDHIAFSQAGMLCEDGRCKTFSANANGYARGEGVGMLLLKPIAAAEAAGDHIYGIIRNSAVNHGGRASSLTAPNPKAQAEVIASAYLKAGMDPRSVGCIETHGTGTSLGDPIEIKGLTMAFQSLYQSAGLAGPPAPHCALAALKSNIGHLELAAGVAGVIKVLLQLQRQTLVKTLHSEPANPYLRLEGTPFHLLRENRAWARIKGPDGREWPRRAGVSSFGFGGVNAHVVIEEHMPDAAECAGSANPSGKRLIVLSAKNEVRLQESVQNLHAFLERRPETSLTDIAFTLQTGREEMEERLALAADSIESLRSKLASVLQGRETLEGVYPGRAPKIRGDSPAASSTDLNEIAKHWVMGGAVDWANFYHGSNPRRISLPTYPFARERCWLEAGPEKQAATTAGAAGSVFLPRWEELGPWLKPATIGTPRTILIVTTGHPKGLPDALNQYCEENHPDAKTVLIRIADQTQAGSPEEFQCGRNDEDGFEFCLRHCGAPDCVFFVADQNTVEANSLCEGEIQMFRLVKAARRASKAVSLDFFLLTRDCFRVTDSKVAPAGAGLTGLAYAAAQGDHRLRLRNIDLSLEDASAEMLPEGLLAGILGEPPSARGEVVKFARGLRYQRKLIPLDTTGFVPDGFRRHGLYVILGGAGRVGGKVTKWLMEAYGATVVWLGRRSGNEPGILAQVEACQGPQGRPFYYQADALDLQSLRNALGRVKEVHGPIHGAIFAGSIFSFDNSVETATEAEFKTILDIKTRGSLNFYEALKAEPLDFLCYFSSAQSFSFSGAAKFSAYAAGITFTDALAHSLNGDSQFPVGCVNWGFWDAGQDTPPAARAAGVLETVAATQCLDQFAGLLRAQILNQLVCMRASPAVREMMPLGEGSIVLAPLAGARSAATHSPTTGFLPEFAASASADELDEWIARLLFVQLQDLPKPSDLRLERAGWLRNWVVETRRILDQRRDLTHPEKSRAAVWKAWEARKIVLQQEPSLAAQIELAETCLRRLPELLDGRVHPTDVLFPGGSMEAVARLYAGNAQFKYFSGLVARTAREHLEIQIAASPERKVRILEIGAGTGGTTTLVLEQLRGLEQHIGEYCYTDISRAFLSHGERNFSPGRPFLTLKIFDVGHSPVSREIDRGAYDLVIAANVLHATKNIRGSLRHAKAALQRNGLLILDEIAGPSLFAHLTFGLLEGWWVSEDESLRIPGSPGLYPESWDRVLREEGFTPVSFPAKELHHLSQQVVLAVSDGLIRVEDPGASAPAPKPGTPPWPVATALAAAPTGDSVQRVKTILLGLLAEFLKIPESQFQGDVPFSDYGVDSILSVGLVNRLAAALGISLNSAILFDHTTINQLTRHISSLLPLEIKNPEPANGAVLSSKPAAIAAAVQGGAQARVGGVDAGIAVIGMSGQFPGAKDIHALWANLIESRDGVRDLPVTYLDLDEAGTASPDDRKTGCQRGGFLEDRACFDPLFFNISPREAESMNPHQRLIMEESWKALEDAAINPKSLAGKAAGIFIGAEPSGYEHESFTGASDAIIASRLAYYLDLKGPALLVNTGCSSSATAVHLACESLRRGESDLALAGGVFATLSQSLLSRLAKMDMLSPTGACHSFDAAADGTVFSEGVGVVALKRLADAVANGDPIYGVITASGMNQDGASNGITAPNGGAQQALLTAVYQRFGVNPEDVEYFEAHGTGTRLGDPVEANAMARAFRSLTTKKDFCAVGSVKAALGHASAAAGVIGLIKVLLMMRHEKIPGQPGFNTLNPLVEFQGSAFHIARETTNWPARAGHPRVAALNSFGHSGTNVHLVVRSQDTPVVAKPQSRPTPALIVLSARDQDRLKESAARLAGFLEENPSCDLHALAHTLQVGREPMKERLAMVASGPSELLAKLRSWGAGASPIEGCWRGGAQPHDRAIQILAEDGASRELIMRWFSEGKSDKIAELWSLGATVDWNSLHPGAKPERLRLPVYPFAREHYWAAKPLRTSPNLRGEPMREQESGVHCFEEIWEAVPDLPPAGNPSAPRPRTIACLLSDPRRQAEFREALLAMDPNLNLVFIRQPAPGPGLEAAALAKSFHETGAIEAILFLWPLEDRALRSDPSVPLALVQSAALLKARPQRIVLAGYFEDGLERCHLESWIGIERSVGSALPSVNLSVFLSDSDPAEPLSMAKLAERLWPALNANPTRSLLELGGRLYSTRVRPKTIEAKPPANLDHKTVLITGGCGGLGFQVAARLALNWKLNLILTGRKPAGPEISARLESLRRPGVSCLYFQADVCDVRAMSNVAAEARRLVGPIHGVIHTAGIKDARTVLEKSLPEMRAVLDPKIKGTLVLDEILATDPIEFACYFSSSSAVLGDFGACDYAVANRFQVAYAAFRNSLLSGGRRNGFARAICWTAWQGGGMGKETDQAEAGFSNCGAQRALRPAEALDFFERLLSQEETGHIVLAGRPAELWRLLGCAPPDSPVNSAQTEAPLNPKGAIQTDNASFEDRLLADLKDELGRLVKLPPAHLDPNQNFAEIGLDSISLADFARTLSRFYRIDFTPSTFFGHSTLKKLAAFLGSNHAPDLKAFYQRETAADADQAPIMKTAPSTAGPTGIPPGPPEPVAIIGLSGRFPDARNVAEMWKLLLAGATAVREIPSEIFAWRTSDGRPVEEYKTFKHKWCGCVPGVGEFDPLFFEISPLEAEEMDPRQRLLLQESWNALEDAGLGPAHLEGRRVGMFVGVEDGDYQNRVAGGTITSSHNGILASRLAYFLDLRGPVMAINTSCSSSLVALHQACQSLRNRECETAIAAGVNLILSAGTFAGMSEAGMLSPDGTCFAFDRRANGMTPGEAVVAVVLKRLSQAVADGDPVHAVILGSGVNYDGKTNGITAPNGVAQAELVKEVHRMVGLGPRDIDYVVTHGTGTRLGDPVEVNALADALRQEPPAPPHCAITSCKTNFGHAFAASGLVSLVALVQALQRETIPASLHFSERNEFIRWSGSPLYVNTRNQPWPARTDRPRIGAVSSFGMSGTNAHVILRDHLESPSDAKTELPCHVLLWSAKTVEALQERLKYFIEFIESGRVKSEDLEAVSRTLLLGRRHFPHRRAVVVGNLAEAAEVLRRLTRDARADSAQNNGGNAVAPDANNRSGALQTTTQCAVLRNQPGPYAQELRRLAGLWEQGSDVDWAGLFAAGASPRRLHLPTYPFSRRHYWLGHTVPQTGPTPAPGAPAPAAPMTWGLPLKEPEAFRRFVEVQEKEMDPMVASLLAGTLQSAGLLDSAEDAARSPSTQGAPAYLDRWLAESRLLLQETGLLAGSRPSLASLWQDWEKAKTRWLQTPGMTAQATLVETSLRALPEVLGGKRRVVDVLFPNSSMALVEDVYGNHPVADAFNTVAGRAVVAWIESRLAKEPGARIRILEVGAGTGGTTRILLPLLDPFAKNIEEYAYTDLSKAFLLHAEERFVPAHPYVKPRLLDVSKPIAAQRVEPRSYDLAIAANVIHATTNVRQALATAVVTLRPGGALILNELSSNGWLTHVGFGMLEGWWFHQDEALRLRGCPAVAPETWKSLLAAEGFARVLFPAEKSHSLGQQIIVAEDLRLAPASALAPKPAAPGLDASALRAGCVDYFRKLLGAALKIDPQELDPTVPLEAYGMDSLMIGRVLARLRESFSEIPGTLLFETQTAGALADHFLAHRRAEMIERLGIVAVPLPSSEPGPPSPPPPPRAATVPASTPAPLPVTRNSSREPIAIIGLSGHYPTAPTLQSFRENLRAGRDSITEIPPERWSLDGFYHPNVEEAIDSGKSYCKWGAFLEGFCHFDPLFFNISPREAMEMDPQERLFLQAAWEVIEDAGYTRKTLAEQYAGRVGVFTGITHTDYNVHGPDQWRRNKWIYPRTSLSSAPNRVSFLMDLQGPSLPVDTMCSSSLTALHEACESILRGECSMAIAGAVNLCLHPSTYAALCAARFLSKSGVCNSFGLGDDGFLTGEGVGVVLLKRLSEAERDQDHIYAVIRGTAINHGGRTNGYTVPNPNAQANVIRHALDVAGVDARAVSYVEAHGTGTKLGDPIEISGLSRAFRQDTADTAFCAVGSVKSNVGHLEAAAGMAGLTKVILQMQHQELYPSLHSETLNPEIDFPKTPFIVQQKLERWERPSILKDGAAVTGPRIAGISSFGAGGANAHVIVQEYEDQRPAALQTPGPWIIVLSAQNETRLKESAAALRQFLAEAGEVCLPDVAYTLQTGREAMEERVGFLAQSSEELADRLQQFITGGTDGLCRGQARAVKTSDRFLSGEDFEELAAKWALRGELTKLVQAWVRGHSVDWNLLYTGGKPRRVSLPTYPFARERYWLGDSFPAGSGVQTGALAGTATPVAPPPAPSWLFLREQWGPQPMPDDLDWRARLVQNEGRRIAIIAADPVEAAGLASLLRQLAEASGLTRPMEVSIQRSVLESHWPSTPEVVLFLGPVADEGGSIHPREKDLSEVFHLSQKLMNQCWGEKLHIYYLYGSGLQHPRLDCEALSGFVRSAMKENENHTWTLIGDYSGDSNLTRPQLLAREWLFGSPGSAEIRHTTAGRQARTLVEAHPESKAPTPFRDHGIYLIAGGFGYLGRQLSLELARRFQATLVLLSRGGLDESRAGHCQALEAFGSKVLCESVDITDAKRLGEVYQGVIDKVGAIHGVFHLARHHEDQMIARKTWDSFSRVLQPKVQGLLNLDELTRDQKLDFFALFSSLGAYGVRGSSDYSCAGAFQNAFSILRNRWVAEGRRAGATTSLCWGPWLEDHLFPETRAKLVGAGFALIGMERGFEILERALTGKVSPVALMLAGDAPKVRAMFQLKANEPAAPPRPEPISVERDLQEWEERKSRGEDIAGAVAARISAEALDTLPDAVIPRVYRLLFGSNGENGHHEPNGRNGRNGTPKPPPGPATPEPSTPEELSSIIRTLVSEILELASIEDDHTFQNYGLDSISGMQLAVRLEKRLKREVPPQCLVNHPTVSALTAYLGVENGVAPAIPGTSRRPAP